MDYTQLLIVFLSPTFSGYKTRVSNCRTVRTEEGPEPAQITIQMNTRLVYAWEYWEYRDHQPLLPPEEAEAVSSTAPLHKATLILGEQLYVRLTFTSQTSWEWRLR